jgi:hypothetical protein
VAGGSPARGPAPLVPSQVNAGEMEVIRRSLGDDRAESDGIPAFVGRNRRQRPRSRGSGYFWNSGERAFILLVRYVLFGNYLFCDDVSPHRP